MVMAIRVWPKYLYAPERIFMNIYDFLKILFTALAVTETAPLNTGAQPLPKLRRLYFGITFRLSVLQIIATVNK